MGGTLVALKGIMRTCRTFDLTARAAVAGPDLVPVESVQKQEELAGTDDSLGMKNGATSGIPSGSDTALDEAQADPVRWFAFTSLHVDHRREHRAR